MRRSWVLFQLSSLHYKCY